MNAIRHHTHTVKVMPFTRIVATVGPSSSTPEILRGMVGAGVDVFRVNCSHISTEELAVTITALRQAVPSAGILVDIQGPKLRTGPRELILVPGETLRLGKDDLSFDPAALGIRPGESVLLGDGTFRLEVAGIDLHGMLVRVLTGGTCLPRRGVNLPDTELRIEGGLLGKKDRADILAARDAGADWLALSFVGTADDVRDARKLAGDMRIVAKIERQQALENLEEIGEAADGLMAARGDLGVELPFENVPLAQQRIAEWGLRSGKVTICATEMLESMRTASRPTRAEVSDVAGAVTQGYGAVMLSAETATGNDPVNVVATMRSICAANETFTGHKTYADANPAESAVAAAAAALAKRTDARHILALTYTGFSAEIISACRPPALIVAATPDLATARRLRLHWGVEPIVVPRDPDMIVAVDDAAREAVRAGLITVGEQIVVAASRLHPRTPSDTIWTYTAGEAATELPESRS
jgi:pyruvate kinase